MNAAYLRVIAASDVERSDLFLAAANRIGTTVQNIEKDFWVCWTLDALFNGLKPGGPRLLFKGGTSLSKAYGLISRFSEDIDVTVFREDIGQPASVAELEALSNKQHKKRLDAIKHACQAYIAGPLRDELSAIAARTMTEAGREPDALRILPAEDDQDRQSLLIAYPSAVEKSGYVRPAVKIESGAKSALDPHEARTTTPYLAEDSGFRRRSIRSECHHRRSRADLPRQGHHPSWIAPLVRTKGRTARRRPARVAPLLRHSPDDGISYRRKSAGDRPLAADCVRHARMFSYRRELGLETAEPGTFALSPRDGMIDALRRDYAAMSSMIFGSIPKFEDVLASIRSAEQRLNAQPPFDKRRIIFFRLRNLIYDGADRR